MNQAKSHTVVSIVIGMVVASAWSACGPSGGGDGGGSAQVSTGLPPSQPLSEISEADTQTLCDSLVSAFDRHFDPNSMQRFFCTTEALPMSIEVSADGSSFHVDTAACQAAVNECMSSGSAAGFGPDEFELDPDDCAREFATDGLQDCDATISELEACYSGLLTTTLQLMSSFTCSSDLEMYADIDEFDLTNVPACSALQSKCPNLELFEGFDDDWDDGDWDDDDWDWSNGTGGGGEPAESGCENTCVFANDNECDDGGPGSLTSICALGTDCNDCGPR